jgi:hypothetical protein
MRRFFYDIPNVAFIKIVKQYAIALEKPYLTLIHQEAALINYVWLARELN